MGIMVVSNGFDGIQWDFEIFYGIEWNGICLQQSLSSKSENPAGIAALQILDSSIACASPLTVGSGQPPLLLAIYIYTYTHTYIYTHVQSMWYILNFISGFQTTY